MGNLTKPLPKIHKELQFYTEQHNIKVYRDHLKFIIEQKLFNESDDSCSVIYLTEHSIDCLIKSLKEIRKDYKKLDDGTK